MARTPPTPAPADLRTVQRQFENWRATKAPRERIPQRLWHVAVRLTRAHGVWRVARWLRLNSATLHNRIDRRTRPLRPAPHIGFVEATLPPGIPLGGPAAEYALELEQPGAPTLRIRARGALRPLVPPSGRLPPEQGRVTGDLAVACARLLPRASSLFEWPVPPSRADTRGSAVAASRADPKSTPGDSGVPFGFAAAFVRLPRLGR